MAKCWAENYTTAIPDQPPPEPKSAVESFHICIKFENKAEIEALDEKEIVKEIKRLAAERTVLK